MSNDPRDAIDRERDHEESWYARVLATRFFEREGFRRLVAANLAAIRRLVPIGPTSRIVSIGSGLGDYELALAPEVATVVGYDLSATAVAEATRRARAAGVTNAAFVARAIEEIDLPPASADVVLAIAVFHHLGDAAARAAALHRVIGWLAPGGWLHLWDPSARALPRRLAAPLLRRHASFHSPHEAPLDPEAMTAEVADAGFADVRLDYSAPLGGPLPWVAPVEWRPFWSIVHAVDRAWLAAGPLRRLASQFTVTARRPPERP